MSCAWSILAHRLSTGLFSGMALTVSFMGVPMLRNSSDPLPPWKALYEGGKYFSIITSLTTLAAGLANYYQSGKPVYLISTGLHFAIIPFTIFVMGPGIKRLYGLDKKQDNEIRSEIETWASLHWFRVALGLGAFLTVLMSDHKCLSFKGCSRLAIKAN